MRWAVLALVLAGCWELEPEPMEPGADAAVPDDVLAGEGVAWTWGEPACARTHRNGSGNGIAEVRHYDRDGKLVMGETEIGGSRSLRFRSGFDRAGRLMITETPGSRTSRWTRDEAGRVTAVWHHDWNGDTRIRYERDDEGRLLEARSETGTRFRQRWTYDRDGRVTAYFARTDEQVVSDAMWTYDAAGRAATAHVLGHSGEQRVFTTVWFTWDGDHLVHQRDVTDTGTWDHATSFVWDQGELVEIEQSNAALGVVSTMTIERGPLGPTLITERDAHGNERYRITFDRGAGRVVRTYDRPGDPGEHLVDVLEDTCAVREPREPILDFGSMFDPRWPMSYLPYVPDV